MFRRVLIFGSVALAAVVIAISVKVTAGPSTEKGKKIPVSEENGFIKLSRSPDVSDFPKVTSPRTFSFPADYGPHPEYRIEWWYYVGNLDTDAGRHFGYQLTFFRMALTSKPVERKSTWRTNQVYMAHFALTDVENRRFYAFERKSRGAVGLAGASATPFSVWVENWSAVDGSKLPHSQQDISSAEGDRIHLSAVEDEVAIDLILERGKPPVLVGDKGMSQKSRDVGNASYYYSLTRMPTHGTIRVEGKTFQVRGASWLDREWGSGFLAKDQAGWNWFGLQLSDGREVMFYVLRQLDGSASPFSRGLIVSANGAIRPLALDDVHIDVLDHWQNPVGGIRYPSRWRLQIPSEQLMLVIDPYLANQELNLSIGRYWEGAVRISGTSNGQSINGNGYVELTGFLMSASSLF